MSTPVAAVERGRKAEQLIKAIDALRGELTVEQLGKVAYLDTRIAPPPGGRILHLDPVLVWRVLICNGGNLVQPPLPRRNVWLGWHLEMPPPIIPKNRQIIETKVDQP